MADPFERLFPQLTTLNFESVQIRLIIITCTFGLSAASFFICYFAFSTSRMFQRIPLAKNRVMWCRKFIHAIVIAVFVIPISFYCVLMDDTLQEDPMHATTTTLMIAVYACFGFYIYETTALIIYSIAFNDYSMHFIYHHFSAVFICSVSSFQLKGHFFILAAGLLEFTTPFAHIYSLIKMTCPQQTRIRKLFLIITVHLFHCRNALEVYYLLYLIFHHNIFWMNGQVLLPAAIIALELFVLFWATPKTIYALTKRLFTAEQQETTKKE